MSQLKLILLVLLSLLVIVVAVQNHSAFSTAVNFQVDLLFFKSTTPPMSLYLVTIIAFLCGVLLTGLLGVTERFRLKKQIKTLERLAKEKDKELNSLRNLPLTGGELRTQLPVENSNGK